MSDLLETVRFINLVWASVLFIGMSFYGVLDLFLSNQCDEIHVDPESRFWAISTFFGTLALVVSVTEIFFDGDADMGGVRAFAPIPFLVTAAIGLYWGRFRVVNHKKSIRSGACGKHEHV